MEIIQRLCIEENKKIQQARRIYLEVLSSHGIAEILADDKVKLTADFLDHIACSNLDFKDAIHLGIAKKLGISLCTHDKKVRGDFSSHDDKKRFYSNVFKPQELIKPKK